MRKVFLKERVQMGTVICRYSRINIMSRSRTGCRGNAGSSAVSLLADGFIYLFIIGERVAWMLSQE